MIRQCCFEFIYLMTFQNWLFLFFLHGTFHIIVLVPQPQPTLLMHLLSSIRWIRYLQRGSYGLTYLCECPTTKARPPFLLLEYTKISSMKTLTKCSKNELKTRFIKSIKAVGALVNPKNITKPKSHNVYIEYENMS